MGYNCGSILRSLINDGDTFALATASGTEIVFEFDPSATPSLSDPNHVAVRLDSDPAVLAGNIAAAVNGLGLGKLRRGFRK